MGNAWYRTLRTNEALKEGYAAAGRNYTAQREFRRRWAEEQFQLEMKKVSVREDSTDFEGQCSRNRDNTMPTSNMPVGAVVVRHVSGSRQRSLHSDSTLGGHVRGRP